MTCDCTALPQISRGCICRASAVTVVAVTRCRRLLRDTYTPAGVRVWLNARNRNLDGVPAVMLLDGRHHQVIAEAQRVAGG